uniref:Glutathione peroxidase n=1 Tax=Tetraselmis sp. GSL018 TaxID=582737 RepID=A0A061S317_9CHLO|mmetsp:Transcript_9984/g.23827  ORF Transcript_9984/g.23827 Transcript_9984/m.23827 type:complete len:111 (+) Transcript_9984:345-677(+)|eukprot:CAMPEP_0177606168 /NCGR_PEP_ID=MMETSP0419_2-20121207/17147_1 /TAXON_ID=582737 /ORGANISM="Tetraselmis sp., Strain GSL018" /LENGTH=110 /DNA_ID=CAMNT_0019100479 /DNA_START=291 /DNA_END=623 /DNA_ORIENTATION=+
MAFPCNQFAHQEPGTNQEIKQFAQEHGFSGILMDKVDVNGPGAHPVYRWLKEQSGDTSDLDWNFAKFLVRPDGSVYGRYSSAFFPNALRPEIDRILSENPERPTKGVSTY